MAAPGATSPLPGALAKARQPNPQRPFAVGSGTGRRRMAKSAGRARGSKWLKSMVNVAPSRAPRRGDRVRTVRGVGYMFVPAKN